MSPMPHDRGTLLHILRNSYGWSEETVRDARHMAADELERLWHSESVVSNVIRQLQPLVQKEIA